MQTSFEVLSPFQKELMLQEIVQDQNVNHFGQLSIGLVKELSFNYNGNHVV